MAPVSANIHAPPDLEDPVVRAAAVDRLLKTLDAVREHRQAVILGLKKPGSTNATPRKLPKVRVQDLSFRKFKEIGRGGEAVVYQFGPDLVGKIYHLPNAPEYVDNDSMQQAALVRIREVQHKLFAFPLDVPDGVVAPTAILVNPKDQVIGYIMPFVKGISLDKLAKRSSIANASTAMPILRKLHTLVSEIHAVGIVIGDFNENNIIIAKKQPFLLDADSMQFGSYECRTFMPGFVDPQLLKSLRRTPSRNKEPKMVGRPNVVFTMASHHSELSDWYSFMVIAMRLIVHTGPYGGFVPKMDLTDRIKKNITVFDRKRVRYPQTALPLKTVPRPLLEAFVRMFVRGERFVPDVSLFS